MLDDLDPSRPRLWQMLSLAVSFAFSARESRECMYGACVFGVCLLLLLSLVVQSALASITAHHSGISLHVE